MSLRVARRLAAAGTVAQVLDLRWLAPLPVEDLLAAARSTGRVLIVDETRHSGGVGEGVITALVEGGFERPHRAGRQPGQLRARWVRPPSTCSSARTKSRRRRARWLR